ncbi:glutamate--cysteine ligase [Candidatus Endobugula sertula]|uniref:Glutamate--cysteine ligase n=1 Tax=Candidatus Endobugula sertula TaxID=62101 RepID=A0A1D2QRH5_9GAMM|nr:glutamate--cysteine ligase [Candidatus Endobugula sertula]
MPTLTQTLQAIATCPNYAGIIHTVRGIEKESLRTTPEGTLATSMHPQALGSALTHPHMTTDYSEALLEFITSPNTDIELVLKQLYELHTYTYQHIGDEQLWVSSMPCMLGKENDIPIAQYGSSNSGVMKSIYRLGLGHRYGRSMQTIAGIHYNFSVPDELWMFLQSQENSNLSLKDFKTQGYFRLIRNFRRYFWLLVYLFGASPSVCKSFIKNRQHTLVPFGNDTSTLYAPFGTSLRIGDLGYQSNAQQSLIMTYNCLESYIQTLCCAITQTHPYYRNIGTKDNTGQYQQLNDSLLQIENEFYSVVRPKRTSQSGEPALSALAKRGVEYIEVRCLDLNPYNPVGINKQQMQFLDTFLLYCLLSDSPASDEVEHHYIQENQKRMVYQGRDPNLMIYDRGKERSMREWGHDIMVHLVQVANVLDNAIDASMYSNSVMTEAEKLQDDTLTPSARILIDMEEQQMSFYHLVMKLSLQHKQFFLEQTLNNPQNYRDMARSSLKKQEQIEHSDTMSLDHYLTNYFSQYACKAR